MLPQARTACSTIKYCTSTLRYTFTSHYTERAVYSQNTIKDVNKCPLFLFAKNKNKILRKKNNESKLFRIKSNTQAAHSVILENASVLVLFDFRNVIHPECSIFVLFYFLNVLFA